MQVSTDPSANSSMDCADSTSEYLHSHYARAALLSDISAIQNTSFVLGESSNAMVGK